MIDRSRYLEEKGSLERDEERRRKKDRERERDRDGDSIEGQIVEKGAPPAFRR